MSTIARRVGCTRQTAQRYIDTHKTIKTAWESERESLLDMAEGTLYKKIAEGDSQDAKWILARLGKHRGFGDKQELEVEHKGDIVFRVVHDR